jgi:hypothetical protein
MAEEDDVAAMAQKEAAVTAKLKGRRGVCKVAGPQLVEVARESRVVTVGASEPGHVIDLHCSDAKEGSVNILFFTAIYSTNRRLT